MKRPKRAVSALKKLENLAIFEQDLKRAGAYDDVAQRMTAALRLRLQIDLAAEKRRN